MSQLAYYGLSFKGRRAENQDKYLTMRLGPETCFLAVADGMGGTNGGQIASGLVLESAEAVLSRTSVDQKFQFIMKRVLEQIFQEGQKAIAAYISQYPEMQGMGTTLSCVIVHQDHWCAASIGDSRIYLLQNQVVKQISVDHTPIQEYKNKHGQVDPALVAQYGHILLKSMDGGSEMPDIFPADESAFTLKRGQGFLLCSDGLITDKAGRPDKKFARFIFGRSALQKSAQDLIGFAFHSGSTDNITVVLAEYGKIARMRTKLPDFAYPPREGKFQPMMTRSGGSDKNRLIIPAVLLIVMIGIAVMLFRPERNKVISDFPQEEVTSGVSETEAPFNSAARLTIDANAPFQSSQSIKWGHAEPKNIVDYYEVCIDDAWEHAQGTSYKLNGLSPGNHKIIIRAHSKQGQIKDTDKMTFNIQ
ncbi:serine/threonine-protein phosphatase [bacterium]|nr:serine/threonine-protein phosphatase [bacterium]